MTDFTYLGQGFVILFFFGLFLPGMVFFKEWGNLCTGVKSHSCVNY